MIHRRRKYGPFDYEWSKDFLGVELMYTGKKFGEYCSREEIFADLKEFQLPRTVVEVGSIVLGSTVCGILDGLSEEARRKLIIGHLEAEGFERFADGTDPEHYAA